MKEDNRKRISLPPELHDQFIGLKTDDESITELVERCIGILSPQDPELHNEHTIVVAVEPGDYDYMRFVLGIELPQPLDPGYTERYVTMLVDYRALFPHTESGNASVRPEREIYDIKAHDGQTLEDASREFFASQSLEVDAGSGN